MSTYYPTRGGPAMAISEQATRPTQGRTAISLYLYDTAEDAMADNSPGESGPATPVYLVSNAELAAGTFVLEADPKSTPAYTAPAGMIVEGGPALPVYIINALA